MKIEIKETGQILDVELDIALDLILNGHGVVIENNYDKKIYKNEQGSKVIELICKDSIGIIDS